MKIQNLITLVNQTFNQNDEWFPVDLRVDKDMVIFINIAITGNKSIQVTFDSGANWVDFALTKALEYKDTIQIQLGSDSRFNMRFIDSPPSTVQRVSICSEYSGQR